ncbi:hypothetical protein YH64_016270 [Achromobacter sp. LC458]|jgi:hypothetical protein|uniref:hypothetical protein n=1 Tax=Achromobacter TaxID=222 RepID=UPI0011667512|nr:MULTISPECIES: hypothetical protein [unclassified Achromobacter]MPS82418.1 hypothetical protein [Achromobacter sp.]TRM51870.1 hypothetical protein YH64_016270 [Achromobacter sp. LC458]
MSTHKEGGRSQLMELRTEQDCSNDAEKMYYSFKIQSTRRRLQEAMQTVVVMQTPADHSENEIAIATKRMVSHAKEIEAVCMTLRVQGCDEGRFVECLQSMTAEHVFVELSQASPEDLVIARQFRDLESF